MKFNVKITQISSIDEMEGYWSTADFIELLSLFDFSEPDADNDEQLKDLLLMAITDFEPDAAAHILLTYKLRTKLSKGQIDQLSHEMIDDKVSEEYPDISLHPDLFQINQLLYAAYNGNFPHVKATKLEVSIEPIKEHTAIISPEFILKVLANGLTERSIIKRLFSENLRGKSKFPEAAGIIWKIETLQDSSYRIITSEYWLEKEDIAQISFIGEYIEHEIIDA